jgi:hypothetical protein
VGGSASVEAGRGREILERRLRAIRARAAIKRHEIRQIPHAGGVWFRLRRLLADAERVLLVSAEQAAELIAEGFSAEAIGAEFEPAKTIICVPADRVAGLAGVREARPAMSVEILSAPWLVIVRF